jgi:hypothetical protein
MAASRHSNGPRHANCQLHAPLLRRLRCVRRPAVRRNENSPYPLRSRLSWLTQPLLLLYCSLSRPLIQCSFGQGVISKVGVMCFIGRAIVWSVRALASPLFAIEVLAHTHGHEYKSSNSFARNGRLDSEALWPTTARDA